MNMLKQIGLGLWLAIWLLPVCTFIFGGPLALLAQIMGLIFGQGILFGLLLGLAAIAALGAYAYSLIGFFRGVYLAWVMSNIACRFAPFVICLGFAASLFQLPFDISGFVVIVLCFGLFWLGKQIAGHIDSDTMREKFSVHDHMLQSV